MGEGYPSHAVIKDDIHHGHGFVVTDNARIVGFFAFIPSPEPIIKCVSGSKLVVFSYSDGKLTPIQTITAYKGKGHGSADIHLSPDGRYLYTSHRLKDDGIAIFYVDPASGKVEKAGYQPTGKHPRNFAITPDGRYLLCACRDDNVIEIYSINKVSGALVPTGKNISVGAPVCIQFLK